MTKRPCATLVIDTVDWAEQLCIADLCAKNGKSGIEDFGYGKGWEFEKESFGKFLNKLTEVINAGINVTPDRARGSPEVRAAGRDGKLRPLGDEARQQDHEQDIPADKEWADIVLFCNYKTVVVQTDKDGKKHKAQGNRRVMYTQHHPCWDAKNRYGLPGGDSDGVRADSADLFKFGIRNAEFGIMEPCSRRAVSQCLLMIRRLLRVLPRRKFIRVFRRALPT